MGPGALMVSGWVVSIFTCRASFQPFTDFIAFILFICLLICIWVQMCPSLDHICVILNSHTPTSTCCSRKWLRSSLTRIDMTFLHKIQFLPTPELMSPLQHFVITTTHVKPVWTCCLRSGLAPGMGLCFWWCRGLDPGFRHFRKVVLLSYTLAPFHI